MGQHIDAHSVLVHMSAHRRDSLEGSKVCCSVLQPGQIDVASWISLGYFCLFLVRARCRQERLEHCPLGRVVERGRPITRTRKAY